MNKTKQTMKTGKTMKVVKPFVFSHPGTPVVYDGNGGVKAAATPGYQREFLVGEQEMTSEMVDHPWIKDGADGAIDWGDDDDAPTPTPASTVVAGSQAVKA